MDAWLSAEAFRSLEALRFLTPAAGCGFLLGHKRGRRFHVERTLPTQEDLFPSLESYSRLQRLTEEKIIGFYSFGAKKRIFQKILSPLACGKLFIRLTLFPKKGITYAAYLVDYEKKFLLIPVALAMPKKQNEHRSE